MTLVGNKRERFSPLVQHKIKLLVYEGGAKAGNFEDFVDHLLDVPEENQLEAVDVLLDLLRQTGVLPKPKRGRR